MDIADRLIALRIVKGVRPSRPSIPNGELMSDAMWLLTTSCWKEIASERPSAEIVVGHMKSIVSPADAQQGSSGSAYVVGISSRHTEPDGTLSHLDTNASIDRSLLAQNGKGHVPLFKTILNPEPSVLTSNFASDSCRSPLQLSSYPSGPQEYYVPPTSANSARSSDFSGHSGSASASHRSGSISDDRPPSPMDYNPSGVHPLDTCKFRRNSYRLDYLLVLGYLSRLFSCAVTLYATSEWK